MRLPHGGWVGVPFPDQNKFSSGSNVTFKITSIINKKCEEKFLLNHSLNFPLNEGLFYLFKIPLF